MSLGYWSSGKRLVDSARISGDGVQTGELPEYIVIFVVFPVLLGTHNDSSAVALKHVLDQLDHDGVVSKGARKRQ